MSLDSGWSNINSAHISEEDKDNLAKEQHAKDAALAKSFARCFSTTEGQQVLEHLTNEFLIENGVSLDAVNYPYELAYRDGERGSVKYIIEQIKRAQVL